MKKFCNSVFDIRKLSLVAASVLLLTSSCVNYEGESISPGMLSTDTHPRIKAQAERDYFFWTENNPSGYTGSLSEEVEYELRKQCRHGKISNVTTEIRRNGLPFWGREIMTASATCTIPGW